MAQILALLTGALLLTAWSPASLQASSFGAGIENSQWYLTESVFECTLVHEVPGYGRAVFRHRAGEDLGFYLESETPRMRPGSGQLVVEAPLWRPGGVPRVVGAVQVAEGSRPVSLGVREAMVMVEGLLEGMAPTVTRAARYGGEPVRVRVSNINFASPFAGYQTCTASLLPVNYDQIKRSRIPFAVSSSRLGGADRQLLDNIAEYVLADTTIERVFVDGHTDGVGSRIKNRALSEERANAVADYLIEQGVDSDLITVRAHADQYPASSRPADNRRATIRLQRAGERPALQQASGYAAEPSSS